MTSRHDITVDDGGLKGNNLHTTKLFWLVNHFELF